jgi:hypothetical protein
MADCMIGLLGEENAILRKMEAAKAMTPAV